MRTSVTLAGVRAIALGLVVAGSAACDVTMGAPEYSVREEKTFAVTAGAQVSLKTWDGSIEIRGWDKNEVRVEVEKRGPDQETVDRIKVNATQSGNTVTVDIVKPSPLVISGFRTSPSASLVVSVPINTAIVAHSGDGSIKVRRITGNVDVETDDGSLSLEEITGELIAKTGDGSVRGSDITGRAAVKTGDGGIEMIGVWTGLTIETNDGSIKLVGRKGSRADEAWELTTGDGNISLTLPEDFAAELDAHTGDGRVQVEQLDTKAAPESGDDHERTTVRGKLGAGGKALRLRTGDGRISIIRQ